MLIGALIAGQLLIGFGLVGLASFLVFKRRKRKVYKLPKP